MKFLLFVLLTGCAASIDVNIPDSTQSVHIVNPIIEFCERLYPDILYPDEFERELLITDCMKICQESGDCSIDTTLPQENML